MTELGNPLHVLGGDIVDSALKVHRELGPGLLESVYEACLAHELRKRNIAVNRQVSLPIQYGGEIIEGGLRLDLVVANAIIVEIKAVDKVIPIHEAQLLTYLKLSGLRVGFLINFNVRLLKEGVKRYVM